MPNEIQRRRTFAIVSHPDAGKTTLTEKLLLYGGAIRLAGNVKARKSQRSTTSDWMELEKQRGISISSTVLQFDYDGYRVNLLDTPGHKDFSEDTYRVLTAVDAAVMVIDAGKGIESQTRKLFEICRRRGIPIFAFMNKMDRPARDPLDLLDELERVLGLPAVPMNWPLGSGAEFKGVWDRASRQAHLFDRTPGGAYRAPVQTRGLDDPALLDLVPGDAVRRASDDIAMLEGAGASFDAGRVLEGKLIPVYFGSALSTFGVQLLLDGFLEHSSPPRARSSGGRVVAPEESAFSGFVFKLQANMDPNHRDCIAFIRVVSGRFERDMQVIHTRSGRKVRLSNSSKLFGRDRETVDEAWPGDIIGIVSHEAFGIGDTLSTDADLVFDEVPRFAPECFAYLQNPIPSNFKRFREGLSQLLKEGVIQSFDTPGAVRRVPLLGAVGPLQFDIVRYRLESEYGAPTQLEPGPWTIARWLPADAPPAEQLVLPQGAAVVQDVEGHSVLLLANEWMLQYTLDRNEGLVLNLLPPRPDRIPFTPAT
ncbi:MAG: peptide chain release factor 3 [Kiritimatiellae bacterium]|nr:peptide chain release factor 3 [Kiritimatiellia bacterium]